MALSISDVTITSRDTGHIATAWPVPDEPTLWTVTWLPGRNLTRDQAITAMLIAEMCSVPVAPGSKRWVHVSGLAVELGLDGAEAVRRASGPPHGEGAH